MKKVLVDWVIALQNSQSNGNTTIDLRWICLEKFYQDLVKKENRSQSQTLIFNALHRKRSSFNSFEEEFTKIHPECHVFNKRSSIYYDWDGTPMMSWEFSIKKNYFPSHVEDELVNGWRVCTVWLGLNFAIGSVKREIFETMIFKEDENVADNQDLDHYQWRYSTYEQALEGHKEACELVKSLTDTKNAHQSDLERTEED